jgi:hypothetical protein
MPTINNVEMPTTMTGIQDACHHFFLYRNPKAEFVLKALLNAPLEERLKAVAKKVVLQEYMFALLAAEASKAIKTRTVSRMRLFHKAVRVIKIGGTNVAKSKTRRFMIAKLNTLRTLHLNEAAAIWVLLEGMKKADV